MFLAIPRRIKPWRGAAWQLSKRFKPYQRVQQRINGQTNGVTGAVDKGNQLENQAVAQRPLAIPLHSMNPIGSPCRQTSMQSIGIRANHQQSQAVAQRKGLWRHSMNSIGSPCRQTSMDAIAIRAAAAKPSRSAASLGFCKEIQAKEQHPWQLPTRFKP